MVWSNLTFYFGFFFGLSPKNQSPDKTDDSWCLKCPFFKESQRQINLSFYRFEIRVHMCRTVNITEVPELLPYMSNSTQNLYNKVSIWNHTFLTKIVFKSSQPHINHSPPLNVHRKSPNLNFLNKILVKKEDNSSAVNETTQKSASCSLKNINIKLLRKNNKKDCLSQQHLLFLSQKIRKRMNCNKNSSCTLHIQGLVT